MDPNTILASQYVPGNVQVTQNLQGYGTQSLPQVDTFPNVQTTQFQTTSVPIQTTQYQTTSVPAQTTNTFVTSVPATQTFQTYNYNVYQNDGVQAQLNQPIEASADPNLPPLTQTVVVENPVYSQSSFATNTQEVNTLPPIETTYQYMPQQTEYTNVVNMEYPQTTYNTVVTQENQFNEVQQFTPAPQQVEYVYNQPVNQEIQAPIVDNNVITTQYQATSTPEPSPVYETGLTLGNLEATQNVDLGAQFGEYTTTTTTPNYETTTTTQKVIQRQINVVPTNISVVPMPILPPPQEKVIVKVPKIQRVVVPKIQRVIVPTKKRVIINRQNALPFSTSTVPVAASTVVSPLPVGASVATVGSVVTPAQPLASTVRTSLVAPAVPRPVVPLVQPTYSTVTSPLPYSTLSQPARYSTLSQPVVPGPLAVATPAVAALPPRPVVPVAALPPRPVVPVAALPPRPVVPVTPLAPRPVVPLAPATALPVQTVPQYSAATFNPLAARGVVPGNLGMARPALYNASSYRPALGGNVGNNMGFTGKYTTRTYNARRL